MAINDNNQNTSPIDPAAPTTFQQGVYQVSNMMYPDDLMGDNKQYGGNYVIFYINVHEDSYLIKDAKVATVDGRAAPRVQSAANGLSTGGVTAAVVGGGAIVGQVSGMGTKALSTAGINATAVGGTVANVAAGGLLAGATIAAVGGAKKEYKQMKQAIALHTPNDLSIRYSASWDASSLAGTMAMASVAENMGKAVSNLSLSALKQAGGAGVAYAAGIAMKTPGAGQLLSKTSGTAANPKKEQLFQEVDFRTFTFNYQFFPRSKEEAKNIQNIIKAFKLHMHPEYKSGTGQFLYIYPSEFDIVYYQNGKENMNVHRHTSCVLTDMSVAYAPQGLSLIHI